MARIGRKTEELAVGQKAVFTRTFTDDDVKKFAAVTWDHNPYHMHPEFAARARFGRPIVHGMLVAAAFTHFGGDFFPGPGILAYRVEMDFPKPVFPGDAITFTCEITAVDPARERVTYTTTGVNAAGDVVCLVTCLGIPTAIDVPDAAG